MEVELAALIQKCASEQRQIETMRGSLEATKARTLLVTTLKTLNEVTLGGPGCAAQPGCRGETRIRGEPANYTVQSIVEGALRSSPLNE